jgi:hypothetical protein
MPETDDTRHIKHEIGRIHEILWALVILIPNPFERELAMSALTDLQALGVRIDAVTAALPTDVATAVAAQKATDDAANAANVQELSDIAAEVTTLTAKVVALETAAGVPPVVPASLTVTAVSFSAAGGSQTTPLTVSGGTGPFSVTGLPAGVTSDGVNVTDDGSAVAGTTTATVTDSSSPVLTGSLSVVVA